MALAQDFNTEGMLDMYLFENVQLLEQLEATTLDQKDAECFDAATINEFFRIMHTIKGSSGIMMYDNITEIAHKLEDVFYYLRESNPDNVPHLELVDFILKVSDFISGEFDKIKEGEEADGSPKELVKDIDKFLNRLKKDVQRDTDTIIQENMYVAPKQFYIGPMATSRSRFYKIWIRYKPDVQMSNMKAYAAVYALREIAEDILFTPEDIISDELSADIILSEGFHILLQAQADQDEVLEKINSISGVESIQIDECDAEAFLKGFVSQDEIVIDLDSPLEEKEQKSSEEPKPGDYVIKTKEPGKPKQFAKQQKDRQIKQQQSFISVNIDKMDMLMDLIGEIVIAEAMVLQNPDLKAPGLNLSNFQKSARQLTKFTSELQDVIMEMRMVPLSNTFQKMNRIVFDTSRKLGKEIELEIIGENTEVDKNIIEHISDPLMHLIRNAVDHGIEEREDRAAAGKDPKGRIWLEAKNEGGKVFIIVRDDGKGLNQKTIFEKAQKSGLISERKYMSDYTDKEIYQFITFPGFSTKSEITEVSGRGVGMDVVMKNIQDIGGRLDIDSKEGEGSVMTMKIPLTLAIIEGIVMTVGSGMFVIETSAVKEFLSIRDVKLLEEPSGDEYVMVREECYPLIRLQERYQIEGMSVEKDKQVIIILEHEEQRACILIDELIGEQEIVVKPIPVYINKVEGISGCTQLGDGNLALIIDVGGLI